VQHRKRNTRNRTRRSVGKFGNTGVAARSPSPVHRHDVSAHGAPGWLRSPTFSIVAGIIAPIACFALQPSPWSDEPSMLPPLEFVNNFWLFSYSIIGLEMLVLALRLAFGARLGVWNAPIAGVLFAGALFAGGIELLLLPFSLPGLVVIIGALGFVPFLTAVVYFAHSIEAYHDARVSGVTRVMRFALLGGLLIIGVPTVAQVGVSLAIKSAIRDVAAGNPTALAQLRAWYRFAPRNSLVWSYEAERDSVRRQRLADAYKELTGEDLESRLSRLAD
jgi:hypothetical protein